MAAAIRLLILQYLCVSVVAHGSLSAGNRGAGDAKILKTQRMMGGWHYDSAYGRQYLAGTNVTIQGTIAEVGAFQPQQGMKRGSRIILKTDKGLVSVHLGPYWYIQEQGIKFEKGQRIEVEGRQIGSGDRSFVIASTISQGQEKWVLRDAEGIPHWCAVRPSGPITTPKSPQEKSQ